MAFDLIGKTLGPYRIDALLGVGGMSEVYKAYQPSMDRFVAVKALSSGLSAQPEFRERFRREAKLIAQLKHTHILPVFDFGEAEGHAYLVMPLMENGTIATRVRGRRLPLDEIVRVGTQMGDALDYAHEKGMIHRDVKPGNILLDTRGNCLLGDFGIARLAADTLTPNQGHMGTPAYMAPEQADNAAVDGRSDLYSLGVVLFELATGRRPFESDDPMVLVYQHVHNTPPAPRSIDPSLPEQLEWVILHAMAKRPDDRFVNGAELARALRPLATSERSGPDQVRPRASAALPISGTPVAASPTAPTVSAAALATAPSAAPAKPAQPSAPPGPPVPPTHPPARQIALVPQAAAASAKPQQRLRWPWPKRLTSGGVDAAPKPPAAYAPPAQKPSLLKPLFAGIGGAIILVLIAGAVSNFLRGMGERAAAVAPPTPTYAAFATSVMDAPTATSVIQAPAETPMPPLSTAAAPVAPAPAVAPATGATETPLGAQARVCAAAHTTLLNAGQTAGLGCPTQPIVQARRAFVQRFERGIMVLFLRNNASLNGGTVYALAQDGRAWRLSDRWSNAARNRDAWYSCRAAPGLTPAQSGVPWRSFGQAWCNDAALADALGAAVSEEEEIRATFQSYDNGRVFALDGWPGAQGFAPDKRYAVTLSDARTGSWR